MTARTRWIVAALALVAALCTAPADGAPMLWTVKGAKGTLIVAGSVHALRADQRPLPADYDLAYARADRVVLEVEIDTPAAEHEMAAGLAAGLLPRGETLQARLGPARWAEAERLARAGGFDLAPLSRQAPWLAALVVSQRALAEAGLDPDHGVDQQLLARARRDGKPVRGLERAADQLGLFRAAPADEQATLLLQALADLPIVAEDAARTLAAWRDGDLDAWDDALAELAATPVLRSALLDARHARWVPQLEALLDQPGTTLVVVGSLHLVGERSVLAGLARRGHAAERGLAP